MLFTTQIKRFIYPLYIYPKITSRVKSNLQKLFLSYKINPGNNSINAHKELRLFSNMEEDGIILKLLAALNIEQGYFIDIGSNDCINSNCANLAFNFNWKGIFIDASEKLLKTGRRNYKLFGKDKNLKFVHSMLYPENINPVIMEHIPAAGIDFMSIDIDGNDYAIWQALECVNPKIVVIENKIEYGSHDIVVPVSASFSPAQWGASIVSITKLAQKKGYTLIATNKQGFNSFYLRNDCLKLTYLRPLQLQKVFNSDCIKNSFYTDDIMRPLLLKTTGL